MFRLAYRLLQEWFQNSDLEKMKFTQTHTRIKHMAMLSMSIYAWGENKNKIVSTNLT